VLLIIAICIEFLLQSPSLLEDEPSSLSMVYDNNEAIKQWNTLSFFRRTGGLLPPLVTLLPLKDLAVCPLQLSNKIGVKAQKEGGCRIQ
jgi:hypothetical protein